MPNELQQILEKELKLKKTVAKKVSFGIHRFVFFPVKESLSALYQTEVASPAVIKREKEVSPQKKKPAKKDVYREIVD